MMYVVEYILGGEMFPFGKRISYEIEADSKKEAEIEAEKRFRKDGFARMVDEYEGPFIRVSIQGGGQ